MPLKRIDFKPGINRERTRYASEGGWYDCDKIRFRDGYPEKIKGWTRVSANTFQGICRSLWNWATLANANLVGLGTHLKFYIEQSGSYYDITPLRATNVLTDPFATTLGSAVVTVTHASHGALDGDFVSFTGSDAVGGLTVTGEYQITYVDANSYTVTHANTANSTSSGGGTVTAKYQVNTGNSIDDSSDPIQLWSQGNFGEDLVFAPRGGKLCYWDATNGVSTRGTLVADDADATEVPATVNYVLVSDTNRFVFAFGCPPEQSSVMDPMLIRWSDQEAVSIWKASAANQAGSLRLSRGTEIVTARQARQEVLVWTNEAIYGMQYLGAPEVWGVQILGDNITIASQNAVVYVNNTAFWMGREQFYAYDGTAKVLPCAVRKYVFNDFNLDQIAQVHAGINEAHSEVWWFYCSAGETTIDRYVVFNFADNIWYYGTMDRTAWLDKKLRSKPIAATYSNNLVQHESGLDDGEDGGTTAIEAYITSSEFDLDDGHRFALVRRVLPDITFDGSTAGSPAVSFTMFPMNSSGSDYNSPASLGGSNSATVTQGTTVSIEPFTETAFIRVRGRQMVFKVSSTGEGVTWQLGAPRFDLRPSGRK